MSKNLLGTITRIADLDREPYTIQTLDVSEWATGDYVQGEVTGETTALYIVEDMAGDMVPVQAGDRIIGAFGNRAATLEGVGSWREIRGGKMHWMTYAGVIGAFTSLSPFVPRPISLDYCGHVMRDGRKVCMSDFAMQMLEHHFDVPTILIIGTSMSSGKTVTGDLICQELSKLGLKVIGAKLTGAGAYRDILSFKQNGAAEIYDFMDVGLPSTVVPADQYRAMIRPLLSHISKRKPDFLVAEAGASPLEPYNGSTAVEELDENIRCTILCASDPYAVVGVQQAFDLQPDLITGPATNTTAGIELVRKLTGVPGIRNYGPGSAAAMREFLVDKLGIEIS